MLYPVDTHKVRAHIHTMNANVSDFGTACIKVSAPTAFAAFSAAVDYIAAEYPSLSFVFEGPYPVGIIEGAIITGYAYTLREAA
jgi:hypothetical protein